VRKKLVLFEYTYFIDKGKEEEYIKWSQEVGVPHWMSVPGVKEMRSYTTIGSGKIKNLIELESYKAWGKAMDDPKMKEIANAFASYTHGLNWTLWEASPAYPEPLKPSK